jgi:hypothetical protein
MIAGASGASKTTVVTQILLAGHNKQTFLGHEGSGLAFYFLFADRGKYEAEETFDRMNCKDGIPYKCINDKSPYEALSVIAEVAQEGYAIIFIDGGDLLVDDNNAGADVKVFVSGLQQIAEHYGVGFWISTGSGKYAGKAIKEGAERRSMVKGSEVWSRMTGSVFTINTIGDGTSDRRQLIVQHRNAAAEKFELIFQDGLLVEHKEPSATTIDPFLEWVQGQTDWFAAADLQEEGLQVGGLGRTKYYERLAQLAKDGLLEKRSSANRASTFFLCRWAWANSGVFANSRARCRAASSMWMAR